MPETNTRTRADSTELEDQATAVLTMATHRLSIPFRDRAKRFLGALAVIDELITLGINEPEARLFEQAIAARIDARFAGHAATCEKVAERAELETDCREDHTHLTVHIEGETPATLELHADALDRQAAASRTLAVHRRRKARTTRENRGTARQRVGLNGAA